MPARRSVTPRDLAGRPIVVVGASAGGIEALRTLVASLPPDLPASLFVVLHVGATSLSVLPDILTRSGPLAATVAADGEPIRRGRIYVAPPDRHLLVERGRVRVGHGPKEHRFRPAVDPLFRSAAAAYGRRAIGVILSGTLGDGAMGLRALKNRGGLAIVQDPADALFQSMPQRALELVAVDHAVPVAKMGVLLARVCREGGSGPEPASSDEKWTLAGLVCPDCGGALSEQGEGLGIHFRCHTGHAYDDQSLLPAQDDAIENALFAAARALAEKASLLRRMSSRAQAAGHKRVAEQFAAESKVFDTRRNVILRALAHETTGASVRENGKT
jgi:two-component system, chemotaxis family, protein-glutamate methylesterase/glutaminase